MAEKIFGANIESKEIPIELRVRIDGARSIADIMEELKRGGTIQFIVTKSFDLWLTDLGHDRLRKRYGITHGDVKTTGAAWVQVGGLEIVYYDSATDDERAAIRKELEVLL